MSNNYLHEQFNKQFDNKYNTLREQLNYNPSGKIRVAILCTGSYCPPHYGHFEMMRQAANHLKTQNKNVILRIFSPASDKYVQQKLQKQAIPFPQRVKLLENLINECKEANKEKDDFNERIVVDKFEGEYPYFLDYPILCDLFKKKLNQMNILLAYCVGSDLMKYNIHNEFKQFADILIVLERDQMPIPINFQDKKELIFVRNSPISQISSTSIRNEKNVNSQQVASNQQQSQQKQIESKEQKQLFDNTPEKINNCVNLNPADKSPLNSQHQDDVSAVSNISQTITESKIIRIPDNINEFMWTEKELQGQSKNQQNN